MLSGALNISHGLPAIGILNLASNRNLNVRPSVEVAGDEVLLSAIENPPRIGDVRPISTLMADVLARYGLKEGDSRGRFVR